MDDDNSIDDIMIKDIQY